MRNGKRNLIIGIIIGLTLGIFYFHFFLSRYEVHTEDQVSIKIDKWTGQSWRFVNNSWKIISHIDENWEQIDNTLREALNIPSGGVDRVSALDLLKEKHPALSDLSDDELNERIKLVYSKEILVNNYLNDFLNVEKESDKEN